MIHANAGERFLHVAFHRDRVKRWAQMGKLSCPRRKCVTHFHVQREKHVHKNTVASKLVHPQIKQYRMFMHSELIPELIS